MAIELKIEQQLLRNGSLLKKNTKFIFSPLNELFCSLHVLQNNDHNGMLISWKLEVNSKLDMELINEIRYFSPFYEFGVPSFLIPGLSHNISNLQEEIELLKTRFFGDSVQVLIKTFIIDRKLKQNNFLHSENTKWEWDSFGQKQDSLLDDLLKNPNRVLTRFFNFIEWYNKIVFDVIWKKAHIEDTLKYEVNRQTNRLQSSGFSEIIHTLGNDKINWTGKKLMLYQPFDEKRYISTNDRLLFIPSYFIWPHLSVQDIDKGVAITYDINKRMIQQANNTNMETILQAIGDSTRIQILNFLQQTENTTQGLAQLLNLSESTVSRDLNILKSAGLLSNRRVNKYVLYRVTNVITDLIPSFFENLPNEYLY